MRLHRGALALLTLLAFANALPNGFVWIDHWQVESGGLIASSLGALWRSFHEPLGAMPGWEGAAPYARPTVIAVLSLVHWLAGTQPVAYHLTLVLLHLGNVLLAYGLLRALGVEAATAFSATALFAVHPLQTAAVSWISGIADPLCAFFLLLSFRLQFATARPPGAAYLLKFAVVVSYALALGAKETAVVFPVLLFAACFLPRRAYGKVPLLTKEGPGEVGQAVAALAPPAPSFARREFIVAVPSLFLVVGDLLYRHFILRAAALGVAGAFPLSARLRTVPRLILSYIALPFRFDALTTCDDYPLSVGWDPASAGALLALAAIIATTIWCWRRRPYAAFGLTWMLVTLLPVLNIVPILHYRADRFFYLPLLGWSLAGVVLVCGLTATVGLTHSHIARVVGAAALIVLVILTIRRNALFANDLTLFEATVHTSPLCREAHTTLGDAYLRSGRVAEAAEQYQQALNDVPGRASYVVLPKVLINLGMAQLTRGDYAAAEAAFAQAHHLQPELLHPLFGLGASTLALGRAAVAVTWLEKAYAVDPNDPDVVFNLAMAYDRAGRPAEAIGMYQRYLAIAPRGRARVFAQERLRLLSPSG